MTTREEYFDKVKGPLCLSCGSITLSRQSYPHTGGLETENGREWLYFHCRKCGYDSALWKYLK